MQRQEFIKDIKTIEDSIDIYTYPGQIENDGAGEGRSVTIGDLHGNTVKLVYFLLRHNIIKFKDGVDPKGAYEEFVRIYVESEKVRENELTAKTKIPRLKEKIKGYENNIKSLDQKYTNIRKIRKNQISSAFNSVMAEVDNKSYKPTPKLKFTFLDDDLEISQQDIITYNEKVTDQEKLILDIPSDRSIFEKEKLKIDEQLNSDLFLKYLEKKFETNKNNYEKWYQETAKELELAQKDELSEIEINQQIKSHREIFNDFMGKIEVTNKDSSLVRLIGDELADRGSNDYYTLRLLQFLKINNVQLSILISNHGKVFITEYEALLNKSGLAPIPDVDKGQISSFLGLKLWLKQGLIRQDEILGIVNEVYKPSLKLIDYTLDSYGISLFTHAPARFDSIRMIADHIGVVYNDSTKENLAQTIDKINIKFGQIVSENKINEWCNIFNDIENPEHMTVDEIKKNPLPYVIWNRWNESKDTEEARPSHINNYDVTYIHGHDSYLGKFSHVINLDTECGKLSNINTGDAIEKINNDFRVKINKENYNFAIETAKENQDYEDKKTKIIHEVNQVNIEKVGKRRDELIDEMNKKQEEVEVDHNENIKKIKKNHDSEVEKIQTEYNDKINQFKLKYSRYKDMARSNEYVLNNKFEWDEIEKEYQQVSKDTNKMRDIFSENLIGSSNEYDSNVDVVIEYPVNNEARYKVQLPLSEFKSSDDLLKFLKTSLTDHEGIEIAQDQEKYILHIPKEIKTQLLEDMMHFRKRNHEILHYNNKPSQDTIDLCEKMNLCDFSHPELAVKMAVDVKKWLNGPQHKKSPRYNEMGKLYNEINEYIYKVWGEAEIGIGNLCIEAIQQLNTFINNKYEINEAGNLINKATGKEDEDIKNIYHLLNDTTSNITDYEKMLALANYSQENDNTVKFFKPSSSSLLLSLIRRSNFSLHPDSEFIDRFMKFSKFVDSMKAINEADDKKETLRHQRNQTKKM